MNKTVSGGVLLLAGVIGLTIVFPPLGFIVLIIWGLALLGNKD